MHVLWLILFDFLKRLVAFTETREWLVSYERPMIISIQACHICMHCKVIAFTFKSLEKALCIFYNTWKLTHTQNLNKVFFSWKRMLLHLLIITYAAIAQQCQAVLVSWDNDHMALKHENICSLIHYRKSLPMLEIFLSINPRWLLNCVVG